MLMGEQAQRLIRFVVEVPGIEPGSLGEDLVLLRAQFAIAFLYSDTHTNKMSTSTVTVKFPSRSRNPTSLTPICQIQRFVTVICQGQT